MRFDIQPLPVGQIARPFDLARQVQLDAAMQSYWAANVQPLQPSTAPIRQVGLLAGFFWFFWFHVLLPTTVCLCCDCLPSEAADTAVNDFPCVPLTSPFLPSFSCYQPHTGDTDGAEEPPAVPHRGAAGYGGWCQPDCGRALHVDGAGKLCVSRKEEDTATHTRRPPCGLAFSLSVDCGQPQLCCCPLYSPTTRCVPPPPLLAFVATPTTTGHDRRCDRCEPLLGHHQPEC